MQYYLVSLIGLVYYIVVYLLSRKFKFQMFHGLWLPLILNLGIIGMLIYTSNTETTGWAALGYFVLLIFGLLIFLVYLLSWGVHILIVRNRSKI